MPIPHIEKKKHHNSSAARDASSVRKKRAHERSSRHPEGHNRKKSVEKKDGKRKKFSELTRGKKILRVLIFLGVFGFGMGLISIGAAYAWVSKDLADITDLEKRTLDETTKIYDSSGEHVLYEIGDNKHQYVPFEEIDEDVWRALLALEDRRFFDHHGFDPIGLTRAVLNLRSLETAQGASTLTQQFVGNAILTRERTIDRKLKELVLSIRLEQKYNKEEILNFYLNEIYFGSNQQGVGAASLEYFGKLPNDLSIAEAATLASLPKNPPALLADPERLDSRRDYAIQIMADEGYITQQEAEEAIADDVEISETVTDINAPHFVFYVQEYLENKYGQNTVRKGGLRVTTTLDWDKQQKAEQAVNDGIAKVDQYGGSNAALVSIDAHTGQIQAMVGSRDFFDTENDGQVNVTTSLRQPGSSIKPMAYLTAFEKGFTPDTKVYDVETDFVSTDGGATYHPRNYDLSQSGPVSFRQALATSLNIPAVKALYLVGVQEMLNKAEQFGYTSFTDRSRYGLAVVLGGAEVTLLEHTAAYATFAREGEYHPPRAVLRVEDPSGNLLEEWKDTPQRAMDAEPVRTLNSVLSDSGARGYTFGAMNLPDRQVAAKTGTTNDYRDAWTMGYTPSIAAGVWVGNNDNSEMNPGAAGLVVATPIWNSYMRSVTEGTPAENFNAASYTAANEIIAGNLGETQEKSVDKNTGEIIPDECIDTYPQEYIEKREIKEAHTILHYINKDDLAAGIPENPRQDPMYESWETAVINWAKADERKSEYSTEETPKADCSITEKNQQPEVRITSLEEGEKYTKKTFEISARITPGTGRTVTAVNFLIDGTPVDQLSGQEITEGKTVTSNYSANTLTEGRHDVGVQVFDDRGNNISEIIRIQFE